ncbi:cold-inducible protein YdjO-related protein [Ammoniphilus resinae]|uniref:Uncharacterized protein n=1 Tax=Ammoniphilus resinae TaxID=861532 RepID=A0ABS4GTX1_9BACL|nr:cold-inducible protein YdjO-related protein [Ammoniphilus resinae]MBP1933723.1 hypothetical protein [Ammoniphilus resinae]
MGKVSNNKLLAMVCSNDQCDTWYRVGTHFFVTCPTCNVPMVQVEKEIPPRTMASNE